MTYELRLTNLCVFFIVVMFLAISFGLKMPSTGQDFKIANKGKFWKYVHSKFYVHGTVHHISISNKPTRCNWAVIFITAFLDYSTCFGCFLHPSSGVQQLYMQQADIFITCSYIHFILSDKNCCTLQCTCARGCI